MGTKYVKLFLLCAMLKASVADDIRSGTTGFCNAALSFRAVAESQCSTLLGQSACERNGYHTCPTSDATCSFRQCLWKNGECVASQNSTTCICKTLTADDYASNPLCIVSNCSAASDVHTSKYTAILRHDTGVYDGHCENVAIGTCRPKTVYKRVRSADDDNRVVQYRLQSSACYHCWKNNNSWTYDPDTSQNITCDDTLDCDRLFYNDSYTHSIVGDNYDVYDVYGQYHLCTGLGAEADDTMFRAKIFDAATFGRYTNAVLYNPQWGNVSDADVIGMINTLGITTEGASHLQCANIINSLLNVTTNVSAASCAPPPPMSCEAIANQFASHGCCDDNRRKLQDSVVDASAGVVLYDALDFPRGVFVDECASPAQLYISESGANVRNVGVDDVYFLGTRPSSNDALLRVTRDESATVKRCSLLSSACEVLSNAHSMYTLPDARPEGYHAGHVRCTDRSFYVGAGSWDQVAERASINGPREFGWIFRISQNGTRSRVADAFAHAVKDLDSLRSSIVDFFEHRTQLFAVDRLAGAIFEVESPLSTRLYFPPHAVVHRDDVAFIDVHPVSGVVCMNATYIAASGTSFGRHGLLYVTSRPEAWPARYHVPHLLANDMELSRPMKLLCVNERLLLLQQTVDPLNGRLVQLDQKGEIERALIRGLPHPTDVAVSDRRAYVALHSPSRGNGLHRGQIRMFDLSVTERHTGRRRMVS